MEGKDKLFMGTMMFGLLMVDFVMEIKHDEMMWIPTIILSFVVLFFAIKHDAYKKK